MEEPSAGAANVDDDVIGCSKIDVVGAVGAAAAAVVGRVEAPSSEGWAGGASVDPVRENEGAATEREKHVLDNGQTSLVHIAYRVWQQSSRSSQS